jgi:hypothetical protein
MPEMKNQSKQWSTVRSPIKAKVYASRMKKMLLLAFFNNKGPKANLQTHHGQERHHQCKLHCQGLKQVRDLSEEGETRDGPA